MAAAVDSDSQEFPIKLNKWLQTTPRQIKIYKQMLLHSIMVICYISITWTLLKFIKRLSFDLVFSYSGQLRKLLQLVLGVLCHKHTHTPTEGNIHCVVTH